MLGGRILLSYIPVAASHSTILTPLFSSQQRLAVDDGSRRETARFNVQLMDAAESLAAIRAADNHRKLTRLTTFRRVQKLLADPIKSPPKRRVQLVRGSAGIKHIPTLMESSQGSPAIESRSLEDAAYSSPANAPQRSRSRWLTPRRSRSPATESRSSEDAVPGSRADQTQICRSRRRTSSPFGWVGRKSQLAAPDPDSTTTEPVQKRAIPQQPKTARTQHNEAGNMHGAMQSTPGETRDTPLNEAGSMNGAMHSTAECVRVSSAAPSSAQTPARTHSQEAAEDGTHAALAEASLARTRAVHEEAGEEEPECLTAAAAAV